MLRMGKMGTISKGKKIANLQSYGGENDNNDNCDEVSGLRNDGKVPKIGEVKVSDVGFIG